MFSGSETGLYSLTRSRLDLEVSRGTRGARLVRQMARKPSVMLITILIGNNLALETMTLVAEHALESQGTPAWKQHLILMLGLTPIVFLFGELMPKDLYRRRPHVMVRMSVPILWLARYLFWPLERVLRLLSWGLEKLFGIESDELARRGGHGEVGSMLAEGRAAGALEPHAEELARNALKLRTLPVTRAMIPWSEVETLDRSSSDADLRQRVESSKRTRLPVTDEGAVAGYIHQLRVLQAGSKAKVLDPLRPMIFLSPELSVDRALARLRGIGCRMAVIGSAQEPLGIVTLKDLVEEISGDLGGW
ncbi:MAG: putative hemolysin [Candidatus Paceibacteria bacterium]|jgi:putative hemolysin